jgi:nicotinate dehydrogenase subunit A
MTKSISSTLNVNGQLRTTPADPSTALLYVLRNDLELNGAKFGCGAGQCGACTVLVNGEPVRSCMTPIKNLSSNAKITTIEGLAPITPLAATANLANSANAALPAVSASNSSPLSILQNAFLHEQAAQCGYCINGMIMTVKSFLDKTPNPSEDQIRKALAGNLCRCGTHGRIIKAVQRAAKELAAKELKGAHA